MVIDDCRAASEIQGTVNMRMVKHESSCHQRRPGLIGDRGTSLILPVDLAYLDLLAEAEERRACPSIPPVVLVIRDLMISVIFSAIW